MFSVAQILTLILQFKFCRFADLSRACLTMKQGFLMQHVIRLPFSVLGRYALQQQSHNKWQNKDIPELEI